MIKNIIFDLGGVILKSRKDAKSLAQIISLELSLPLSQAEKILDEYRDDLNIGKKTARDFFLRLNQELNDAYTVGEVKNKLAAVYRKEESKSIDVDVIKLIDDLSRNYRLYLLTNTSGLFESQARKKIFNKFIRVFKSFEEKVKKPDKKAYLNVLDKIEAKADECVFIDDLEENVKTAEKIGIKGIVYKNFSQLKKDLAKFEVKI